MKKKRGKDNEQQTDAPDAQAVFVERALSLKSVQELDLNTRCTTRDLRRQLLKHHAVLLGILDKNLQRRFNPPLLEELHLDDTDRLIVLSTE